MSAANQASTSSAFHGTHRSATQPEAELNWRARPAERGEHKRLSPDQVRILEEAWEVLSTLGSPSFEKLSQPERDELCNATHTSLAVVRIWWREKNKEHPFKKERRLKAAPGPPASLPPVDPSPPSLLPTTLPDPPLLPPPVPRRIPYRARPTLHPDFKAPDRATSTSTGASHLTRPTLPSPPPHPSSLAQLYASQTKSVLLPSIRRAHPYPPPSDSRPRNPAPLSRRPRPPAPAQVPPRQPYKPAPFYLLLLTNRPPESPPEPPPPPPTPPPPPELDSARTELSPSPSPLFSETGSSASLMTDVTVEISCEGAVETLMYQAPSKMGMVGKERRDV